MELTAHGGPDALGVPQWDFSSNANACGPEPGALRAVQQADPTRYPDPGYAELRTGLGELHGVDAERIVVAAGASEFIVRMTATVARLRSQARVYVPRPGYGDYARAARAFGLPLEAFAGAADLVWHTVPGNPCGAAERVPLSAADAVIVVDQAYAPLRLDGDALPLPATAWRLHSPNKALGLTGVRAAYAVAPPGTDVLTKLLSDLAPSWPLGAHGVAMLGAWAAPATQRWVANSLPTLRDWKQQQIDRLHALGWTCAPSVTPFFVARPPDGVSPPAQWLPRLRARGIKLRDAESLGLRGWLRLSVQPPEAQDALCAAWQAALAESAR